jgi:hypothetical protein
MWAFYNLVFEVLVQESGRFVEVEVVTAVFTFFLKRANEMKSLALTDCGSRISK